MAGRFEVENTTNRVGRIKMNSWLHGVLAGLLLAIPVTVSAQTSYPDRTIRFVVSASAGGGTDIIARLVAQQLNALWGQPVIVENKTGGAGNLAAQFVARSQPDGYTLFVTFGGVLTINPFLFKEIGFDPDKDFVPVTVLASAPYLMLINPTVIPAKTVKEFIAYAKVQPEKPNWGGMTKGSPDHLAGELFSIMTGIPMNHIPYRGASDALLDVLGGRVPFGYFSIPSSLAHVKAGKLLALGVSDTVRSPLLPEVPTISEAGLPGYEMQTWFAIWAPAGTPALVVDKLYSGVKTVLQNEAVQKQLIERGYKPGGAPPVEFAKFVKTETDKYGKIIKTIGLEKN
jgi:tripartite-type tricarboxylate transporter receptor subunit TctC